MANAKLATKTAPKTKAPAKVTKSDVISAVKNNTSGAPHVMVEAPGQVTLAIPQNKVSAELRKLATVGGSYKAVVAMWDAIRKAPPAPAKAARGVDAQNSPQTAKALADQAARGKAAKTTAPAKKTAPVKAAEKKEAKVAKVQADDSRKIVSVVPNPKRGKSAERFALYRKGMTVAQALAAGLTRGDIAWDSKREFIKFA